MKSVIYWDHKYTCRFVWNIVYKRTPCILQTVCTFLISTSIWWASPTRCGTRVPSSGEHNVNSQHPNGTAKLLFVGFLVYISFVTDADYMLNVQLHLF